MLWGFALVALASLIPCSYAQTPSVGGEYQIKAAFLFNFAKFVEWPASAFSTADEPVKICVLGQNPFGSSLDEVVRGKRLDNRTFVVQEVSSARAACKCHIVFIATPEQKLLSDLKDCTVLSVGETDNFIANGGIVRFKLKDSRVRFEIDPNAADRAKLRISSKLLSLAEIPKRETARKPTANP